MLEKMSTPCCTTTNEKFESPYGNNDFRHMIPSFMEKMRIKPYVVKTKQMFHFPYGTIIYLSSFELMLFCRACRTMFGPPSTSFHHEQNKLHTCRWTQGHQSLIVPTTNLKQVSKNTWMSKHCARLQDIQSRSQPRTKWPF